MAKPEGTYLAWLDCRGLFPESNRSNPKKKEWGKCPAKFFLEKAKVGLNEGEAFGKGGEGHCRLNFACPRSLLEEALQRMAFSVSQ
ncbi:MAG: hypothetical protein SNJ78_10905 [Spirochaetales bacterium]